MREDSAPVVLSGVLSESKLGHVAPGAAPAPLAPTDPGLAAVVEAWPGLPEPIRRAVLALVESAGM